MYAASEGERKKERERERNLHVSANNIIFLSVWLEYNGEKNKGKREKIYEIFTKK